jgi:hypothetical protein
MLPFSTLAAGAARQERQPRANPALRTAPGVPDRLVGEVGDAALEGLGVKEAHGFLVAGLAEQALADLEGTGKIFSRSSSIRSCSVSVRPSWKPPAMTMSPSMCCFSVETSLSTSPLRTVELFWAGLARVADTTYLGRLFSLSAGSPLRDGHRAASHS